MKIFILDNNDNRHKNYLDIILKYTEHSIDYDSGLNNFSSLPYDVLFIHAGNPEAEDIENLNNVNYKRVFFSGGFTQMDEGNDEKYYIPDNDIEKFIKKYLK